MATTTAVKIVVHVVDAANVAHHDQTVETVAIVTTETIATVVITVVDVAVDVVADVEVVAVAAVDATTVHATTVHATTLVVETLLNLTKKHSHLLLKQNTPQVQLLFALFVCDVQCCCCDGD